MSTASKRFTPAVTVIIIFGIISLLGDAVYEAARSANSQYLKLLSLNAAQLGLVFGIGEFLGYVLRLAGGFLSDKSGKHWFFIFIGYGMLIAVPLMGFTMHWHIIVILILMERIGKALRKPPKDTIVSAMAENQVGIGFAFGLQEALDQIGAFIGPLIFTLLFYLTGKSSLAEYQAGYKLLLIPFAALMLFLFYAYRKIKTENLIPAISQKEYKNEKLQPVFWMYTFFSFFCTMGFVNFSLIGFHLKSNQLVSDGNITLLYSIAMIIDAGAALLVGNWYDKLKVKTGKKTGGLLVLLWIPLLTVLLPFLSLSHSTSLIILGMVFFGVVMGTHETVMRSAIADITPFNKRGTGYGVFNTFYGLAFLAGSALTGWFYNRGSLTLILGFTLAAEAIALLLYLKMIAMVKKS